MKERCIVCGASSERHVCSVQKNAPIAPVKPRAFDPTVQPDWTHFGSVRCEGDMKEDEQGNCVIVWCASRWMLDYNCAKIQGRWVSIVGFEKLIDGKWHKEVEPANRLSHWSPPADHISYTASTLPEGMSMMDLMRALDAENIVKRAERGVGLPPLLTSAETSEDE